MRLGAGHRGQVGGSETGCWWTQGQVSGSEAGCWSVWGQVGE